MYKDIFANWYTPNHSEQVFVISKVKNTKPWIYVISNLNGKKIVETFYKKELQKTNQTEFRVVKVIKRKGGKLYVKWKGYNNSWNSWIDKKGIAWLLQIFQLLYKMSQYFPKSYEPSSKKIIDKSDLLNYADDVNDDLIQQENQ